MYFFVLIGIASALTQQECIESILSYKLQEGCISLIISKMLGYLLVGGSLMLKFPQILKIYNNRSVEGISLTSFYVETLSFSLMAAYAIHNRQPFSTYGEHAIISVQCVLQVVLYWSIGEVKVAERLKVGVIFFVFWFIPLFVDLMPQSFWLAVPVTCALFNLVVKYSQISTVYKNGSTGNLSFITNFLNFAGTVSRIFTTITELNDPLLLANYSLGTALNAIVMVQFWIYWNVRGKKE